MANAKIFNPDDVAAPVGAYSHGALVKAGSDILYVAGQVGVAADGKLPKSVREQADNAYANVLKVLRGAAMGPEHLVKLTIFVVQGQAIADVREMRLKHLGEVKPTSTLIFVPALAAPEYLVEVEAVAAK